MTDNAESPDAGEELVDDSRDIALDTSDETELTETPSQGVSELRETMAQQDSEAEKYAIEFLKKVIRIRGVRISREGFLHQELRKLHMSDDAIASAIDSNPVLAGVELTQLDGLADSIISFETNKSTAMSFAAGIPGGFAMLGTIPADLMQYYVHAFRVMQKLAYLYGWRERSPTWTRSMMRRLAFSQCFSVSCLVSVVQPSRSRCSLARSPCRPSRSN